jgi:hypothetical protein
MIVNEGPLLAQSGRWLKQRCPKNANLGSGRPECERDGEGEDLHHDHAGDPHRA